MLTWVDKSVSKYGKVSAVVPRSDLEVELVLKYQIHNCRPGRFQKGCETKLCKYGYALLEDDGLIRYHKSGIL